jgi:hypothetical protein
LATTVLRLARLPTLRPRLFATMFILHA